jgi:tetratricopeptide (TPR) repeat protein
LFLALRSLTGALWRSAAVALLFAVHPLRAESVAWVTERKDVLSALFGFLALWAYAGYARAPSARRYLLVAVPFALSLLAKPMLVTLPFLLLILDWWPLSRVGAGSAARPTPDPAGGSRHIQQAPSVPAPAFRPGILFRLAAEKLPLLALTVASAAVTARAQAGGGAVGNLQLFPTSVRLENAVVSYVAYLAKTFWPADLAVYYPHPVYTAPLGGGLSVADVAGAVLLLLALTAGAAVLRRRAPYLLAGWLWYVGTLVPVLGLVQVGSQAYADRYTYFPQIGILIAVCWAVADLARGRMQAALVAGAVAAVVLASLTWSQVGIWHDSISLWEHARAVTFDCATVRMNLGEAYQDKDRYEAAAACFRRAIELDPAAAKPHSNLGNALLHLGDLNGAASEQHKAIALAPGLSEVYCNLGLVEMRRQRPDRAAQCFRKAIALEPDSAAAHRELGFALLLQDRVEECVARLQEAIRLDGRDGKAHLYLGKALEAKHEFPAAAEQFELAVRFSPREAIAWHDLGMARIRQQRFQVAVECFKKAVALEPDSLPFRQSLERALQALQQGRPAGPPGRGGPISQRQG